MKKRITVQSAKAKGRALQQWVGRKISDLIGLEFGKDKPIESRGGGQSGTDIRLDSEAITLFPFSVECKRQEKLAIPQWIEQAKENQLPGTDWLLVCKQSHREPFVVLDANAFFKLYSY